MTDTKHTDLPDILTQCRAMCDEGRCMSGDTCVQIMHDEPCFSDIADEIARLKAENAALLEACREFVRKVDCGEARSKKSYAQMKAAIALVEGQDNG